MQTNFKNANEAYEYYLDKIILHGIDFDNTKALFNVTSPWPAADT